MRKSTYTLIQISTLIIWISISTIVSCHKNIILQIMNSIQNKSAFHVIPEGHIHDLFCIIKEPEIENNILLICPLSPGLCLINCRSLTESTKNIGCKVKRNQSEIIIHYKIEFSRKHQGKWICQIQNWLSEPLLINVKENVIIESLIYKPNPVISGNNITIICSVKKIANTKLKFSFNIIDAKTDKTKHFDGKLINGWTASLDLNNVDWRVHNIIECIVYNKYDVMATQKIDLNIYHSPDNVKIYSKSDERIMENQKVSLICNVSEANPISYVKWTVKKQGYLNEDVKTPFNTTIISGENGGFLTSSELIIEDTNLAFQNTVYKCMAFHSQTGIVKSDTYILNVNHKPKLLSKFKQKIISNSNELVKLKVKFLSYPMEDRIKWFFISDESVSLFEWNSENFSIALNDVNLISLGRKFHSLFSKQGIATLSISELNENDFGLYICEISNDYGFVNSYFWLISKSSYLIPQTSITVLQEKNKAVITFKPPKTGHYTHIILTVCELKFINNCQDTQIPNPIRGIAISPVLSNIENYFYYLSVFQDSEVKHKTEPFSILKKIQIPNVITMDFTVLLIILFSAGIVGIIVVISILFIKKHKRKAKKNTMCSSSSFCGCKSQEKSNLTKFSSLINSPNKNAQSLLSQENNSHIYMNVTSSHRGIDTQSHESSVIGTNLTYGTNATCFSCGNSAKLQNAHSNSNVKKTSDLHKCDSFGDEVLRHMLLNQETENFINDHYSSCSNKKCLILLK